jgi:multiple sugar transport system permease protein
MIRRRGIEWGLNVLTYVVLLLMLAPIGWLVLSSLQTSSQLSTGTYDFASPTLDAFRTMWSAVDFARYFRNSLIICTAAALLATAFAAFAGYALARWRFRGSGAFGLTVIGTQLIPGTMFLLPIFLAFVWFGRNTPLRLFDTHLGMILVYTAFFTPVAIYFMRYFFAAIPRDLEEAAEPAMRVSPKSAR